MTRWSDQTESRLGQTQGRRLNGPACRKRGNRIQTDAPYMFHVRFGVHGKQVGLRYGFRFHEFHAGTDDLDHSFHATGLGGRVHGVDIAEVLVKDDFHAVLYLSLEADASASSNPRSSACLFMSRNPLGILLSRTFMMDSGLTM